MAANNIWDEFDNAIDTKAFAEEVQKAAESDGDYPEVPYGDYEVKIEKIELVKSKNKKAMVTIWFKILEGEFKGNRIFYNQVVEQPFQVHIANEFLRSLGTDLLIEFKSYRQYGELLMDIQEEIDGNFEHALSYTEGKKGFAKYEIIEVYEVE